MDFLIWWTDQAEAESVVNDARLAELPAYIQEQFISRYGRNGRGRLWVDGGIPFGGIDPWNDAKPAGRLAEKRGGIVIRAKDKAAVFDLPGFLTDPELNFINE